MMTISLRPDLLKRLEDLARQQRRTPDEALDALLTERERNRYAAQLALGKRGETLEDVRREMAEKPAQNMRETLLYGARLAEARDVSPEEVEQRPAATESRELMRKEFSEYMRQRSMQTGDDGEESSA